GGRQKKSLNLSISRPVVRREHGAEVPPVETVRGPGSEPKTRRRQNDAIHRTAQGRPALRGGRSPRPRTHGEDGEVHGGDHEGRRAAGDGGAPAELEGRARPALWGEGHRDRRALHRVEGTDRLLRAAAGEVEGRGDRMDQALPRGAGRR